MKLDPFCKKKKKKAKGGNFNAFFAIHYLPFAKRGIKIAFLCKMVTCPAYNSHSGSNGDKQTMPHIGT